jgi:dihydroorotase
MCPMLNRREFLSTVAGAAFLPSTGLPAFRYDLVIKGGYVIDPANRLSEVMDVGIRDGRIETVQKNLSAPAAENIDASNKLIVPGLIDIHMHARSKDMGPFCLSTGVTSLVDGGSQGADNIDEVIAFAKAAPNRMRILLNIARTGITTEGELLDIGHADVAAARATVERHRDVIIGIKARLSRSIAGDHDLEAVRRARAAAAPRNLPVMVHVGDTASPLPAILALLKSGDIVTHVYSPPPHSIFDDKGGLLPEVLQARRRGILFDIGNGRLGHITWDSAERAMRQSFFPDTISSDLTDAGRTDRVFDFPTVLSKFLLLGMPLDQVLIRATANAAKTFPAFRELGTLRSGAPADLAIFELRQGEFEFVDNENTKRIGRQKLVPTDTVFGGKRV